MDSQTLCQRSCVMRMIFFHSINNAENRMQCLCDYIATVTFVSMFGETAAGGKNLIN